MAEQRSKRLKVVVELAQRAEDEAANRFEAARKALDHEVEVLTEIENYYADYEIKFGAATQGLRAAQLMQSRDFLNRLSEARSGQKHQVQRAEKTLELVRQEWHKVHLKHKALKDLVAQYKVQEYLVLEKIEQKHLDEWVTQQRL